MKVAVLLSGGVDSSVALRLLCRDGHDVTAFYLKIWLEDELAFLGECPWEEDLRYAREVCATAGVPLEVVPLQRLYHERVVQLAIAELRAGRTPSPDVLCNRRVKFGAFLDHLDEIGGGAFERVASGHYARVVPGAGSAGGHELWQGVDPVKDQTYFLHRLDQRQLARCLFPVGGLRKRQVRDLARAFALPNRERKDSQGICFLGKIRYESFVRGYLGERPGEIRDGDSHQLLGEHRGYWFYTIGQRQGLGLSGGPWYVVDKDVERNVVYVAHRDTAGRHRRDRFRVVDPRWIGAPPAERHLAVKLRHSPHTLRCAVRELGGELEVRLAEPDPGLAAGQSAVLYAGERCLGGGPIVTERPQSFST